MQLPVRVASCEDCLNTFYEKRNTNKTFGQEVDFSPPSQCFPRIRAVDGDVGDPRRTVFFGSIGVGVPEVSSNRGQMVRVVEDLLTS